MKFSEWPPAARQGEVRGFLRQGGLELQFLPPIGQGHFEFRFSRVDRFSCRRLFVLRQSAELLQQSGEPAIRSKKLNARLLQRGQIRRGAQLLECRLLQWFDLIKESHRPSNDWFR